MLNLSAYQPSQFTLSHEEIEAIRKEKASKQKDTVLTHNLQREYFLEK
jgi:hypothetical protein